MSGYIEKDYDDEYRNDISSTTIINPSDSTTGNSNTDENLERWDWLISGWETMSFKERMSLFAPKLHFVDIRDNNRSDLDDAFEKNIQDAAYKYCRNIASVKYDPDRKGIPNILVVFDPIDTNAIPDADIKAKVREWGIKYKFITCNCTCKS